MNRYVEALINRIEVDDHLGHYQKLTCAQRAELLTGLFMFSCSLKRDPRIERRLKRLEDRRFTPAVCKEFLKRLGPRKA